MFVSKGFNKATVNLFVTHYPSRPSDRPNDTTENAFRACTHCETESEIEARYPVHTERAGNGDLHIYSCCDYRCLRERLERPTTRYG